MLAQQMYEFRDELAQRGIVFCYSGYMTEEVLTGIGGALKTKLEFEREERARARSLFAIFVEQVQNVVRYSAEREADGTTNDAKELRYGVLTVGKDDGKYFVACSNLIAREDVERLGKNLRAIQDMNDQELKTLYKETLRGETPEHSKGAGVGFIDIARRALHGFDFDFAEINDDHSYFCLRAYV